MIKSTRLPALPLSFCWLQGWALGDLRSMATILLARCTR